MMSGRCPAWWLVVDVLVVAVSEAEHHVLAEPGIVRARVAVDQSGLLEKVLGVLVQRAFA
jgi:hypothetical protein